MGWLKLCCVCILILNLDNVKVHHLEPRLDKLVQTTCSNHLFGPLFSNPVLELLVQTNCSKHFHLFETSCSNNELPKCWCCLLFVVLITPVMLLFSLLFVFIVSWLVLLPLSFLEILLGTI